MNTNAEKTETAADAPSQPDDSFAQQAGEARVGIVAEFWDFLIHNKKWWLTPIILVLLLVGGLVFLTTSSAVAPFIYTL